MITPAPGYAVDPNNPNGVVKDTSVATPPPTSTTSTTPPPVSTNVAPPAPQVSPDDQKLLALGVTPEQLSKLNDPSGQGMDQASYSALLNNVEAKLKTNNEIVTMRAYLMKGLYDSPLTPDQLQKLPPELQTVMQSGNKDAIELQIRLLNDQISGRANTLSSSIATLTSGYQTAVTQAETQKKDALTAVMDYGSKFVDPATGKVDTDRFKKAISDVYGSQYAPLVDGLKGLMPITEYNKFIYQGQMGGGAGGGSTAAPPSYQDWYQQYLQTPEGHDLSVKFAGDNIGLSRALHDVYDKSVQTHQSDALKGMLAIWHTTGQIPPMGMGNAALRNQFYAAVGGAGDAAVGSAAANKAMLTGMTASLRTQETQYGAAQTSIGTIDKQLTLAAQYSSELQRTDSPLANKYLLYIKGQIAGDIDTQNLQNIVKTASYEFAKILSGSSASIAGVTVTSAADAEALLNANMTNGQLMSVIGLMKTESQFRLDSQKTTIGTIKTDITDLGTGGTTTGSTQTSDFSSMSDADLQKIISGQ